MSAVQNSSPAHSSSSQSHDVYLYNAIIATAQAQNEMQRRVVIDVVVGQRLKRVQLFASKDQPLLVDRDALFL
jgi:hypothetical protein